MRNVGKHPRATHRSAGALCETRGRSWIALAAGVVLASFAVSAVHGVTYNPVATSGHDADIVYEVGLAASQAGANSDIGNRQFYEQGISTQTGAHKPGLPRTTGVTLPGGNAINFSFEPFELNNVLKFNNGSSAKLLTLDAPTTYSNLAVVFSAGGLNGIPASGPLETATIPYTVNYAGGLTQSGSIRSPDWSILGTPSSNRTERLLSVGRIGASPPPAWPQTPEADAQADRWNIFMMEIALTHPDANVMSVTFGPATLDDADGQLNADDDVVVFGLAGEAVLTPALSLEVNTATGLIRFNNPTGAAVQLTAYEITSASGSLSLTGWNSFSDQNLDPVDGPDAGSEAGSSAGETWDEAAGASNFALQEGFLLGASTVPVDDWLAIGAAYNTAIDARDLVVSVRKGDGSIVPLSVEYVDATIAGDFDGDLDVDGDDLAVWQANFGSSTAGPLTGDADGDADADGNDFLVWQQNLTAPPSVSAAAGVPEPGAIPLIAAMCVALTAYGVSQRNTPAK